jgi:hypothetical protein
MHMNRERQRRLIAQLEPNERRVMFDAVGRLISYVRGAFNDRSGCDEESP